MLYALTLSLHSWVRWLVVVGAIANLLSAVGGWRRRRAWTRRDAWLVRAWVGVVDIQLLLGMAMYFAMSPVTNPHPGLADAWSVPPIRFFAILHPLAMLGVIVTAHAAGIAARRAGPRFGRVAVGSGVTLLLLGAGVPWPFYDFGRSLVRIP